MLQDKLASRNKSWNICLDEQKMREAKGERPETRSGRVHLDSNLVAKHYQINLLEARQMPQKVGKEKIQTSFDHLSIKLALPNFLCAASWFVPMINASKSIRMQLTLSSKFQL